MKYVLDAYTIHGYEPVNENWVAEMFKKLKAWRSK